jgi:multiple sugar transport system permease protein
MAFRLAAGACVGALSSAAVTVLLGLGWELLSTSGPGVIPLSAGLLAGVAVGAGSALVAWTSRAIALGLAAGGAWVLLAGVNPHGAATSGDAVISSALTIAATVAVAWLTRYALRDLDLSVARRDTAEIIALRLFRGLGFIVLTSGALFPFLFMFVSSLKPRAEMVADPTFLGIAPAVFADGLIPGLTRLMTGYREVLVTFNFLRLIANSTMISVVTVVFTVALAVLGAYAVTRLEFPGRALLSRGILLIYMFPAIVLVIPLYSVFSWVNLRDTLHGLVIVYLAQTLPVALYMLRSYFQTLPKDLEEAGMVDGTTRLGVIWRITLPLSLPALASVGLYVFMIAWNEFLFAFMFLDTPALFTLSRGMVALNHQEVPRQFLMAGAVIVSVPVMVIFFWFERYLIGGLTAGGVKG